MSSILENDYFLVYMITAFAGFFDEAGWNHFVSKRWKYLYGNKSMSYKSNEYVKDLSSDSWLRDSYFNYSRICIEYDLHDYDKNIEEIWNQI